MKTKMHAGLTSSEVTLSREKHGRNEIQTEAPISPFLILIAQFKSPLVLILIVAGIFSSLLGDWIDAGAIFAILTINALIGFFQEYSAEKSILALKSLTTPKARVIRDGTTQIISAHDVVKGDHLLLEAGDVVAADVKLLESSHLKINEAILTGESTLAEKSIVPVNTDATSRSSLAFMGTSVGVGIARAEVIAIGMATELGKIAHLIASTLSPPTPLQVQLGKVGKLLLWVCAGIVAAVFILGFFHHTPWASLVIFSISLAVAVVPEGMPAMVTVALALGVRRLAALHALVRKLPSVETLGSVNVICTDKTGTLTTGEMRVREIKGNSPNEILQAAAACCDASFDPKTQSGTGDPTEIAILIAALETGIDKNQIETINPRKSIYPFDTTRKRMSILRNDGTLYVKGAFESLIPLCDSAQKDLEHLTLLNQELTSRGLRVLAVATGKNETESHLNFLGLIGFADPPREEVKLAIHEAHQAGIKVVMITGDHPATAKAIAVELGLLEKDDNEKDIIHARATPQDKLNIIQEWKQKGAIVAMTGDGVNDAPALREAHIGIAMGITGTEVTRQAADLILTDDHFATIVSAVKEGRGIYQNIRKAIVYLLTGNFGELFVVFAASAIGLPLPFLAAHLLWINLVTDSLPALALIAEPVKNDVMNTPPRPAQELLLGKHQWIRICSVGALEGLIVLAVFFFTLKSHDLTQARNLGFTTLVFSQLWRAFSARSTSSLLIEIGFFSNLWLLGVVIFTAMIQTSLHFISFTQNIFGLRPLALHDIALVFGASLITTALIELKKKLKPSVIKPILTISATDRK